jgi:hypothetical protein
MKVNHPALIFLFALLTYSVFLPTSLFSQTDFYQGKTVRIIHGRDPGGSGDLRVKAMVPFLQKYIPGNPIFVNEYMPGGGGRKTANYIFGAARPDGLTIGNVGGGVVANAVLGEKGVEYDLDKLHFIGSPYSATHYFFLTRKEAGLNSLEKLRSSSGTGYSGPEIDLAMLRGEVDARPNLAETLLRRNPEFVEKGLMNFHGILEAPLGKKHPRFSYLPEIATFARSERARGVLEMFRASRTAGGPYILPPGTPKERADILREAVRKTFNDPGYQAEYKRLVGDDLAPVTAEEIEKTIKTLKPDPETIDLYKKIAGAGPLPSQ